MNNRKSSDLTGELRELTIPEALRRYSEMTDGITRSRESIVASNQGGRAERERLNQRAEQEAIRWKRQQDREAEKAARERDRAEKQAAREQAELHVQQQLTEAASRTRAVQVRVDELSKLLANGVKDTGPTGFESLRRTYVPTQFAPPVELGTPAPPPQWTQYEPSAPTGFGKLFRSAHEQKVADARTEFAAAQEAHQGTEASRKEALADARAKHARAEEQRRRDVRKHNAEVHELEQLVLTGAADAVEKYVRPQLDAVPLPDGLPDRVEVAYLPENRRLLINRDLPSFEVIPPEREFNYVKSRDEITSKLRPDKEIRGLYANLVAQLALLTMHEAFRLMPPEILNEVSINGHVSTKNKATGQPEHPCLVSVITTRDQFQELILDELDPALCLRHLNALVSQHPWDLEPVRPIFDPDLSKYKIADVQDAASPLDSRPVLVEMPPYEFEHLVKRLFEARGLKSWVTQASRDDGVDAIAVNEDPIMGGVCVIQAKRYRNTVPMDAVRALAGTMDDKRAARGVVVTTSGFGPDAHAYAARHGRIQLIEGPELLHLLKEHLDLVALLGDVKVRRRSRRGT